MTKDELKDLKRDLSKLTDSEKKQRNAYVRKIAAGEIQGPLVGYSSIDKPWLGKYPEMLLGLPKTTKSILERLKEIWPNQEESMIDYYDTQITVREFCNRVEEIAMSLQEYGIGENDAIVSSLESVPEYLELLLACELIGCSIKNFIGSTEDLIYIINENTEKSAKLYITPDYIQNEVVEEVYNCTSVQQVITINPLFSVKDKSLVRSHIMDEINSRYQEEPSNLKNTISFDEFLKKGKTLTKAEENRKRVLFTAYTSGSTGKPKGVNHSVESTFGIINQMALFPSQGNKRETWLLTVLPPTLVAVIIAMMLYPLLDGKKLLLDPYCKVEDIDLEMMHYEPNSWPQIPIFFSTLISSKRIPEDYDMGYSKMFGFGAEPITRKYANTVKEFLDRHHCQAPISSGYGQSEGGSDFTIAMGYEMIVSGCSGLPLIDTVISIFEEDTENELGYYQLGEVCKSGPGLMLGYTEPERTKEVLKTHCDGEVWLHTKDYGFMTPDGLLFVLGRQGIKVYSGERVFPLNIENRISDIPGVKEAVVVSGIDRQHEGYEVPYLFVIPEQKENIEELLGQLVNFTTSELAKEECPKEIYFIDEKPIHKFKTDRKKLQKDYRLI